MKRYDSYKDSGVEWIGEIPSHWKKTKHKFNLSILSGYPFKSDLFDNSEGFPLIRIRDISSGKIETYYKGEVLKKFVVNEGDLLVGMDGDFNTRWWDSEQGLLNQRCCSIVEGSNVLRRYLHYVLPIELNIINDLTYYTTVKHLSVDDINNTDTILPPLSEQQQIVSFLDTKTSLIDSLIEKTQRKIELLKEKRTSLINEVVTKGLNPNVEMKDSGVEWIGKIPSHWFINKVGNNTYVKGRIGWKGLRSEDFKDEGPYLITGTDFNKDGTINWDKMYHVEQWRYDEDPFIQLQDNDVLITKDGTIGKVVYVGNLKGQTCLNSGIFLTRPTNNEYKSRFFFWLLNSNVFKVFVDYNSGGSTIQHLYQNVFVNFKFPIPPLSEQQQIVSYLDEHTQLIDKTISIEEKRIELLKEYRQSLISEVVTGKRKVVE